MEMPKKTLSKEKKYSGFSFIESVLAIFVVSVGMIAVLNLLSKNLKQSMDSRDQMVASLLAQEGIELVRNLRDNNWANEDDTFKNFPSGISTDLIDYDDTAIINSGDYFLYKDSSGYFSHDSAGTTTKFKRLIVTYPYGTDHLTENSDLIELRSIVTWGGYETTNPSSQTCNSGTKCAYTVVVLSRWGGM